MLKYLTIDEFIDLESVLNTRLLSTNTKSGIQTTVSSDLITSAKLLRPQYFLEQDFIDTTKVTELRKPKSIKLNKAQLELHRAKHSISPEQKAEIIKAKEIKLYGREACLKRLRKADTKSVLVEKGTRPKGRYYDVSPLDGVFKSGGVDGVTDDALNEARILHFGGRLD